MLTSRSTVVQDGCDYKVEHLNHGDNSSTITVTNVNGNIVATAAVCHNVEQVFPEYHCEDLDVVEGEYPYFEYTNATELAAWLVSTHPEH